MPQTTRPARKNITMADVAARAQCSQSTVSVVLSPNSKIKISPRTRERILKAVEDLGYKVETPPVPTSKPLAEVAVIFDDLTICPEAVIAADGVREFSWESGQIVSVYNCHADEKMAARTIEAVLRRPLVGVIYSAVRTRSLTLPAELEAAQVPVVLLNCFTKDKSVPAVVPGDIAGANRATELLIANGHIRIAHITGEAWMEVSRDRLRGYRDALATADIPFDPALVLEGNWQLSSGYETTRALMQLDRPPTAIFCGNDRMAMGCYEALKELGLRIPQDVSVIGFDDEEIASHLIPKLTSMKYPRRQMGEWAAERIFDPAVAHDGTYRVVKLECELVERDSVAPRG